MRGKVLLGCVAFIVLAAAEARDSLVAQGTARTVNVDVRVDCLAGRGVSFSLTPWTIDVAPGDSINWRLDQGAGRSGRSTRTSGSRRATSLSQTSASCCLAGCNTSARSHSLTGA